jgi:glucans biosynthesis protein C
MISQPRLNALDNLRAIMMWLGIVLHVSVNHIVGEFPIPWRDSQQTLWANALSGLIHSFRMPVFFIVAGFFVAMLMAKRGPKGMLKHRIRRLALPFVIFWPLVFPATVVLMMLFVHQMVRGTFGLDPALVPQPPNGVWISTLHLWFLYLLIWFCAVTAICQHLSTHVPHRISATFLPGFYTLISSYWGILLLALPLALVGSAFQGGVLTVTGSFFPPIGEWIHHGLFFLAGLALYRHQEPAFALLMKRCWVFTLSGLLLYVVWIALYGFDLKNPTALPHPKFIMAYIYNCGTWLLSFGIISAFMRYCSQQTPLLKYLADCSYWSYLVHMLGTIGFGALLYQLPVSAFGKMWINMIATTAFCLLTYQLFVRGRAVGRLLNGDFCQPVGTT